MIRTEARKQKSAWLFPPNDLQSSVSPLNFPVQWGGTDTPLRLDIAGDDAIMKSEMGD